MKSQPLHNFSLPLAHLKWGHKAHHASSSNHRFRRRNSPVSAAADTHTQANVFRRRSPPSHSDGGSDSEARPKLPPRGSPSDSPFSPCSSAKTKRTPCEEEEGGRRLKQRRVENGASLLREEGEAKVWNLRGRRARGTSPDRKVEMLETNCWVEKHSSHLPPKSQRLRGIVEGGQEKKEKKRKFWISLSREEIEEDVYALTGSRPARRPRRRPKAVQKLVDNLFPGLYLVGLTVCSYRVQESL
ncbi:unnamed protein product [Cuscuta campestris]|uniref:DUF1639 domain-containing protein n=1 Tax=Cuscuta campestris TaxID=132261 RepID=A0A484KFN6_9ASTE|nr:unnamed protein product [Cuscuta campestris]